MFNLIVSFIAIALVAVLAIAGVYYGGTSLNTAGEKAYATRLINETEQIKGAVALFKADAGRLPENLNELLEDGKYLQQAPSPDWRGDLSFIQLTNKSVTADICLTFNQNRGIPFVPSCNDEVYKGTVACCKEEAVYVD